LGFFLGGVFFFFFKKSFGVGGVVRAWCLMPLRYKKSNKK